MPYAATPDPYCYAGTAVLKNLAGLRNQDELVAFEQLSVTLRADEPLPAGSLSPRHFRAIHRHLFQDVYAWAGRYRSIRIAKGDSMFCYPEHIASQIKSLFADLKRKRFLAGLDREPFAAELTTFMATLNAIHPFREGNGRTQIAFASLLAAQAGHPLALGRVEPARFLKAMIVSFSGDEAPLRKIIQNLAD